MFWGYLKSLLRGAPRYRDRRLRQFINSYQWKCLLQGKARATRELNAQQAVVWNQQIKYEQDLLAG